tara:strand:- start:57 stop:764 length:708 start_codon:yes stop_codon:yes gene_type:complete
MKNLFLLYSILIFSTGFTQTLQEQPDDFFNYQQELFKKECESYNCKYKYATGFSPGESSRSIMKWLDYSTTDFKMGVRKMSGQYQFKYMLEKLGNNGNVWSPAPVMLANSEGDFRLTFDVIANSKVERYGVMLGFKDFENFCALEIIPSVKQAYVRTSIQGIEIDHGPFFINDDTRNGNINIVASGSNIIFAYNGKPIKMIPKNLAGSLILIVMRGNGSARTYIDNFKLTKQKLN